MNIEIDSEEEKNLRKELATREDADSKRMARFLGMSDLTRTEGSPIKELIVKILEIPRIANLDVIKVPEIVPASVSFDLFNFPSDHPARSKSDTYYVDEKNILRTHTTVMWYYYLNQQEIKERIAKSVIKKNKPVFIGLFILIELHIKKKQFIERIAHARAF